MWGGNQETKAEEREPDLPEENALYKRRSICSVDENYSYNQYGRNITIPAINEQNNQNNENLSECNASKEDSEHESLPYPTYMPISLYCLDQRSAPRSWCLKMISNPYPFHNLRNSGMCSQFITFTNNNNILPYYLVIFCHLR